MFRRSTSRVLAPATPMATALGTDLVVQGGSPLRRELLGIVHAADGHSRRKHDGRRQDGTGQGAAPYLIDTRDERETAIPPRLLQLHEPPQAPVLRPTTAAGRLRTPLASSASAGSHDAMTGRSGRQLRARSLMRAALPRSARR
jgi:hypothetical protein